MVHESAFLLDMSVLRRDEIITRWNLIPVVHPVSVLWGMWDFTSERIAVKSRTGSCGRFHPPTHFYGGILFGGIFSLGASTSAGKGEHPRLIQRGYPRLVALGGSRSCATADGTPVDTDAKNCVPPISTIDGARRGGIVVEAWGRRLFTTSFCVRRNLFLRVLW